MAATPGADCAKAIERVRIWLTDDRELSEEYVTASTIVDDVGSGAGAVEEALGARSDASR